MRISFSRWRPDHLLAAWSAYWIGLATATLTPTIIAIARATSAGSGKSSVSASLGNSVLSITVTEAGKQTFAWSAHLLPAALWVAVPPLALYGVWLLKRSRALARDPEVVHPAVPAGDTPDFRVPAAQDTASSNVQSRAPHA